MKVFIIGFIGYAVFVITNILQCKGSLFTIGVERGCFGGAVNTQVLHGGIGISRFDYCDNETLASVANELCFSDVIHKLLCCVAVTGVLVPIGKVLRQSTKLVKTKVKNKTKCNDLNAVLNAINVGVIATDSQMKVTFMNSTAGQMCGWCPRMAVGMPIHDVVRFKIKEREVPAKNMLVKHSKDEKTLLLSYEGRYIDVQQVILPLPLSGKPAGTVTQLLDVTTSRELVRELTYSASHDALTGLPNRASFEKRLHSAVISCGQEGLQHALVFVDLDGFKLINDSAGHAAGDALLKQIALLMHSQLRHSDFVARLGGDEFGLILFNCGLSQAKTLMNLLVNLINEYSFSWEGKMKHVGASVGITSVGPLRKDVKTLMAEADEACYAAKRRGKGQVCVFSECAGSIFL